MPPTQNSDHRVKKAQNGLSQSVCFHSTNTKNHEKEQLVF